MYLRNRPANSTFFAGSRALQSDLFTIAVPPLSASHCAFLAGELLRLDCLSEDHLSAPHGQEVRFFKLVAAAHATLLRNARFFLPEPAELVEFRANERSLLVAIPKILMDRGLSGNLLLRMANTLARLALAGNPLDAFISRVREELADAYRPEPNFAYFARAAFELGMPILEWQAEQLQIGYGERAAVFNGSVTHQTPGIGVYVARDKALCNALFAQAGFPIAAGGLAPNLAAARERAHAIGYPVVVKPADKDGGQGVSSDIRTQDELDAAYKVARAVSRRVLVEKHIAGKDYRLLFYRDQLLVAIERTPGGVTGNGRDTVAALIENLNASPDRGPGPDTPLHSLVFNDEAELMLRRQGLAASSVPADGAFIALRRAANFALGGSVRLVDEEIHPDNLDLALRATRLLRLDLAGLDLILPDISRSWHENGGAICEVNAQPFIGEPIRQNHHRTILEQLVPGDGRIPLVLVVGQLDPATINQLVEHIPQLAVIDASGARLNGHPVSLPGALWVQACQTALLNPHVAAGLCILDPAQPLPVRSPVDRFSAAYLLDAGPQDATGSLTAPILALLRRSDTHVRAPENYAAALSTSGQEYSALEPGSLAASLIAALSPAS